MSRQPPRRSMLRTLFSALTRKTPRQAPPPIQPPQRPALDDREAWYTYWKAQSQSWRTEPEIDTKRQKELDGCRAITPDIERGIYPFNGMKLSRADVEWLLATHENGRGPIDWSDEKQREREGLDLRGADVSHANLGKLPLARLRGSTKLQAGQLIDYTRESAMHAEDTSFAEAHLEGAYLSLAHLKEALFAEAHLEGANLSGAFLEGTNFIHAHLEDASLSGAHLEGAHFMLAQMRSAHLSGAHLERADFGQAWLEKVVFDNAQLQKASLFQTHLEGADLCDAHLEGAELCSAFFDQSTKLEKIVLMSKALGCVLLADVHWGDVNVTVVDWSQITMLGDEQRARQRKEDGETKDSETRLTEYLAAIRANRQLAVVLREQGLNEDASRFAYRAQILQRKALWFQMTRHHTRQQKRLLRFRTQQPRIKLQQRAKALSAWLFSWFLSLLAGYGYKPERSFLAYLLMVGTFTALYLLLNPHLAWYEAIVVSMTAFHGRGFSPSTFSPGDSLSITSAVEAFVGLIIEVTFIATLTRRFFGQ
jgi:uncharacterized protein YjbI with pentapeptide repeats